MKDHQDAIDRKERSERTIASQGLPVLERLPCLVPRSVVRLRSQDEVVTRAACLAAIYYRTGLDFLVDIDDFMREERLFSSLTKDEKEFYFSPDVREHPDYAKFSWRIEAFHVLLWALGSFDRLEAPEVPVDPKVLYHHFFADDVTSFRSRAALRPLGALLDMADLYFRYFEIIKDSIIHGDEIPRGLILEIVRERYLALLWLLGKDEWDRLQRST